MSTSFSGRSPTTFSSLAVQGAYRPRGLRSSRFPSKHQALRPGAGREPTGPSTRSPHHCASAGQRIGAIEPWPGVLSASRRRRTRGRGDVPRPRVDAKWRFGLRLRDGDGEPLDVRPSAVDPVDPSDLAVVQVHAVEAGACVALRQERGVAAVAPGGGAVGGDVEARDQLVVDAELALALTVR